MLRSVYRGMCWPVKAISFMFVVYWSRISERGVCWNIEEKARIASLDRRLSVRLCCIGLWHDDE